MPPRFRSSPALRDRAKSNRGERFPPSLRLLFRSPPLRKPQSRFVSRTARTTPFGFCRGHPLLILISSCWITSIVPRLTCRQSCVTCCVWSSGVEFPNRVGLPSVRFPNQVGTQLVLNRIGRATDAEGGKGATGKRSFSGFPQPLTTSQS